MKIIVVLVSAVLGMLCALLFKIRRHRRQLGPLFWAARKGSVGAVMDLIRDDENVNRQSPLGFTALHVAVLGGHEQVVDLLLAAGARTDLKNIKGNTALHCAAEKGFATIAAALISRGANVNARGEHSETPLHLAAAYGHREVAELLLRQGAKAEITDDKGFTPIKCAEINRRESLADLISRAAKS
jgi:ankyrin repeat protein